MWRGGRFVFAVALNKNTVYPEYMPSYYRRTQEETNLDRVTRRLAGEAYFADLSDIQSAGEAYGYFASRLDEIAATAEAELKARGCDRPVTVTLGEELFPDRHYDGFSLPAGEYTALRVAIGDAQGQNWWCVMFPPLCTSSAVMENLRSEAVFSDGEWRIITSQAPDVAIRFKLLEWWAYIKKVFKKRIEAQSQNPKAPTSDG